MNITKDNLDALIDESNKRNSRNGDPLSFYLETLTLKIIAAQQDSTLFAEITEQEIEALELEIKWAKKAQESYNAEPF